MYLWRPKEQDKLTQYKIVDDTAKIALMSYTSLLP